MSTIVNQKSRMHCLFKQKMIHAQFAKQVLNPDIRLRLHTTLNFDKQFKISKCIKRPFRKNFLAITRISGYQHIRIFQMAIRSAENQCMGYSAFSIPFSSRSIISQIKRCTLNFMIFLAITNISVVIFSYIFQVRRSKRQVFARMITMRKNRIEFCRIFVLKLIFRDRSSATQEIQGRYHRRLFH